MIAAIIRGTMGPSYEKIITAGVGPIIVISACGLLCLAFYNRLAAVVTRLRAFHREHLHEQDALAAAHARQPVDSAAVVRHQDVIGMLDVQIRSVTRRAELIRRTLLCLLLTIACLAVCSMCLGLSTIWIALVYVAAPLFIVGLMLLVVAVCFAMAEMKAALDPVELESRFVRDVIDRMEHA
jgi:hypothetical protein